MIHCLVTLHTCIIYIPYWNCIQTLYRQPMAAFQNVSYFMLEQSIVFHNAAVQNIYNVFYFKTLSMCIFNAVKKQSGIRFIVYVLFGYFAYLHSLYTVVELHTNFVLILFGRQSICTKN